MEESETDPAGGHHECDASSRSISSSQGNATPFFPPVGGSPNSATLQNKVFGQPTHISVDDLPTMNLKACKKSVFQFRADGTAIWNNKIFNRPKFQPEEGRGFGNRVLAVMEKHKQQKKVQSDFQGMIQSIIHEQQTLPGVGSRVVVRLQKPFLGHRADGIVKYVGVVPDLGKGVFVGLELMEAIGDHDGCGHFFCRRPPASMLHYGIWVRGSQIEWSDNVSAAMRKEHGIGQLAVDNPTFISRRWWVDRLTPNVHSLHRLSPKGSLTHR